MPQVRDWLGCDLVAHAKNRTLEMLRLAMPTHLDDAQQLAETTKLSDWPRITKTYEIETHSQTETPRPVRWSAWFGVTAPMVQIPAI